MVDHKIVPSHFLGMCLSYLSNYLSNSFNNDIHDIHVTIPYIWNETEKENQPYVLYNIYIS